VKTGTDGSTVRLSDVARVELGSENYGIRSRINGHPGAGFAVSLAPGADALKTAELVKAKIAELSRSMPPGFKVAYPL
ncbi:efflux RND transporter permease subunit, partial [Enterococcus faecium]